jgi:hypothetical protein
MMLQSAEVNRNPKKSKKPFTLEQFCLYADREKASVPSAKYGAAANALIKKEMFPAWALFVYSDLQKNANNAMPPEPLAFVCESAILLSPSCEGGHCTGMLIAEKPASGKIFEFHSPCGKTVKMAVPIFKAAAYAEEDVSLAVI